jgi:hypothetical protein
MFFLYRWRRVRRIGWVKELKGWLIRAKQGNCTNHICISVVSVKPSASRAGFTVYTWVAIDQLLSIILKLRILVLLPVSNLPYVVEVNNYSLIGE